MSAPDEIVIAGRVQTPAGRPATSIALTLGDALLAEAPVRGGAYALCFPAPDLAPPPPERLEALLPGAAPLDALGDGALRALLDDLQSVVPEDAPLSTALRLHLLAQGADVLASYGATEDVQPLLQATLELRGEGAPLLRRAVHVSRGLAGHRVGVDLELLEPSPEKGFEPPPFSIDDAWQTKLERLWEACRAPAEPGYVVDRILRRVNRTSKPALRHAFEVTDWVEHDARGKFPHRYGVVGEVELEVRGTHPFTGLFERGGRGLIRLSSGLHNRKFIIPGASVKFPVTGARSLDMSFLHRVEGQGDDQNFFAHPLRTQLAPPGRPANTTLFAGALFAFMQRRLHETTIDVLAEAGLEGAPTHLPLDELACVDQDGALVEAPRVPVSLTLQPTDEVAQAYVTPQADGDAPAILEALAAIEEGTPLFRVWADGTHARLGRETHRIGTLWLRSPLVRSAKGDSHLHFTHWFPRR